jgi:hypothetical protein
VSKAPFTAPAVVRIVNVSPFNILPPIDLDTDLR